MATLKRNTLCLLCLALLLAWMALPASATSVYEFRGDPSARNYSCELPYGDYIITLRQTDESGYVHEYTSEVLEIGSTLDVSAEFSPYPGFYFWGWIDEDFGTSGLMKIVFDDGESWQNPYDPEWTVVAVPVGDEPAPPSEETEPSPTEPSTAPDGNQVVQIDGLQWGELADMLHISVTVQTMIFAVICLVLGVLLGQTLWRWMK